MSFSIEDHPGQALPAGAADELLDSESLLDNLELFEWPAEEGDPPDDRQSPVQHSDDNHQSQPFFQEVSIPRQSPPPATFARVAESFGQDIATAWQASLSSGLLGNGQAEVQHTLRANRDWVLADEATLLKATKHPAVRALAVRHGYAPDPAGIWRLTCRLIKNGELPLTIDSTRQKIFDPQQLLDYATRQ